MKHSFFPKNLLPIRKFVIQEASMEPTYYPGDTVLINCWFNRYKNNDVVIFIDPQTSKKYIKRIIKTEASRIWVQGDNKKVSVDSRQFGAIKLQQIIGRVIGKI